ncbi:MAG: class I SAM-dependent methyltransferase [Candidatus Bathyarchaeota archaeon]|nr:class I SAM-dependent methyltransferase [Candidatus Bathyarchaeota archaeon]
MKADVAKFVRFCDSLLGKQILRKEAAYIYNELQGSEAILDVGCGIGSFEQHLPTLNIIGLDVSEDMLEEARKRSDKTFIQGDATDLTFHDAIFDAVFTVTTLEFLEDYQKAIQEIARVTKPRGKLLVMMLNPSSEYFRENVRRPGDYFQRIKHTDTEELREYVSRFYVISKEDLFLGIHGEQVFETDDENLASLYVLVGIKKQ